MLIYVFGMKLRNKECEINARLFYFVERRQETIKPGTCSVYGVQQKGCDVQKS